MAEAPPPYDGSKTAHPDAPAYPMSGPSYTPGMAPLQPQTGPTQVIVINRGAGDACHLELGAQGACIVCPYCHS